MDDTLKDSWDNSQDPISKQIKERIQKVDISSDQQF